MPTTASGSFSKIFNWDGVGTSSSDYTDITRDVQALNNTAVTILNSSAHYLYLGNTEKFDMAIFDLDTAGSLGALTWEFSSGTPAWTEFTPSIDREEPDGTAYGFSEDGAESFSQQLMSTWATETINGSDIYWVRVTAASVATAPTVKRIQMRALNAYATTQEVFEFLQLQGVFSTPAATVTDFTSSTIPSKTSVQAYISGAQSEIDYKTRKSWRPNVAYNEHYDFNFMGIRLNRRGAKRIFKVQIWEGDSYGTLTEGRANEYFFNPDTGIVYFSRYFFLPARFGSFQSLAARYGGGEFIAPVRISYQYGENVNIDAREGGYVHELTRKLAAIAIVRNSDFGNIAVGGMDRVPLEAKVSGWHAEAQDALESLRAVELF